MSNGYKWLLALICIGIMAVPFAQIMLPIHTDLGQKSEKNQLQTSSASGVFIIPPGGKEVSRDTTGYRVAFHNIGDRAVIYAQNPEALYLIDEDGERIRIKEQQTVVEVCSLNKKDYIMFANFGNKTAKVRVKIISRRI